MNAAMQAQHQVSDREAVSWIARQLRWERTLDVLRGDEKVQLDRAPRRRASGRLTDRSPQSEDTKSAPISRNSPLR